MSENKCSCCEETLTLDDMICSFVEHMQRIVDVVIEDSTLVFEDDQGKQLFFALALSHTADMLHSRARLLFFENVNK